MKKGKNYDSKDRKKDAAKLYFFCGSLRYFKKEKIYKKESVSVRLEKP